MRGISRRDFLRGASLLPVVSFLPRDFVPAALVRKGPFLVLNDHQAAVVEEATARLIPGPRDDSNEVGHPGAREAKVVRYVDAMLGALERSPESVFAGGPFSDRAGGRGDDMRRFVRLDDPERLAWKGRLRRVRRQYATGVRTLDTQAGGDFTKVPRGRRDQILGRDPDGFTSLLFQHAIEGMYSVPEYGGNAGRVGWKDIRFPGDVQPRGYRPAQVSNSDGPDPYVPFEVGDAVLKLIGGTNPLRG